jgi:hypothetical protein
MVATLLVQVCDCAAYIEASGQVKPFGASLPSTVTARATALAVAQSVPVARRFSTEYKDLAFRSADIVAVHLG